jgi:hypothetical protein
MHPRRLFMSSWSGNNDFLCLPDLEWVSIFILFLCRQVMLFLDIFQIVVQSTCVTGVLQFLCITFCNVILQKGYPTDSASYSDPSIISQRLPVIVHKTQKLKVHCNFWGCKLSVHEDLNCLHCWGHIEIKSFHVDCGFYLLIRLVNYFMILFVEREKGNDIQWMNKDISLRYSVFMFV